MTRSLAPLAGAAGALMLAACGGGVEAPYDPGVCFVYEPGRDGGEPTFNRLAENQAQIEECAARLEEMRLRFLRMGGNRQEVTGAYQGQFIFIDAEGVKIAKSLDGARFMALARTGDGRLAVPGAITRDATGRPIAVAAPPEPPAGQ